MTEPVDVVLPGLDKAVGWRDAEMDVVPARRADGWPDTALPRVALAVPARRDGDVAAVR
jgi:hypothetical protein